MFIPVYAFRMRKHAASEAQESRYCISVQKKYEISDVRRNLWNEKCSRSAFRIEYIVVFYYDVCLTSSAMIVALVSFLSSINANWNIRQPKFLLTN